MRSLFAVLCTILMMALPSGLSAQRRGGTPEVTLRRPPARGAVPAVPVQPVPPAQVAPARRAVPPPPPPPQVFTVSWDVEFWRQGALTGTPLAVVPIPMTGGTCGPIRPRSSAPATRQASNPVALQVPDPTGAGRTCRLALSREMWLQALKPLPVNVDLVVTVIERDKTVAKPRSAPSTPFRHLVGERGGIPPQIPPDTAVIR